MILVIQLEDDDTVARCLREAAEYYDVGIDTVAERMIHEGVAADRASHSFKRGLDCTRFHKRFYGPGWVKNHPEEAQ